MIRWSNKMLWQIIFSWYHHPLFTTLNLIFIYERTETHSPHFPRCHGWVSKRLVYTAINDDYLYTNWLLLYILDALPRFRASSVGIIFAVFFFYIGDIIYGRDIQIQIAGSSKSKAPGVGSVLFPRSGLDSLLPSIIPIYWTRVV